MRFCAFCATQREYQWRHPIQTAVVHPHLTGTLLSAQGIKALADALALGTNLTSVSVACVLPAPFFFEQIDHEMVSSPLHSISSGVYPPLGTASFQEVRYVSKSEGIVRQLAPLTDRSRCTDNNLEDDGAVKMAHALLTNTTLHNLDIAGVFPLSDFLPLPQDFPLRPFLLTDICRFESTWFCVVSFFRKLFLLFDFVSFILFIGMPPPGNRIAVRGAIALAAAIRTNSALQSLDVHRVYSIHYELSAFS